MPTGAVRQFQLVNSCLKMTLQGRNMLQFNVIFMAFLNKEEIVNGFCLH
jgi:hypothetical protein